MDGSWEKWVLAVRNVRDWEILEIRCGPFEFSQSEFVLRTVPDAFNVPYDAKDPCFFRVSAQAALRIRVP